jgi:predicted phage terminase large subunit-like protein
VEVNQFQQLLADELNRVSRERNILLPLYTLDNRVKKLVRIRRLTPWLAQKRLRFKGGSPGARLLVEQLRDFPNGDHDDGPDALEMAIRLAGEMLNDGPDEVVAGTIYDLLRELPYLI